MLTLLEEPEEFREDESIILLQLLDYIGKKEKDDSILEYIIDFCQINNYHIGDVADLIKRNKNFKNILKEDCIARGILRDLKNSKSNNLKLDDDW